MHCIKKHSFVLKNIGEQYKNQALMQDQTCQTLHTLLILIIVVYLFVFSCINKCTIFSETAMLSYWSY